MTKNDLVVTMYVDGACKGNGTPQSRGGWGVVLECAGRTKELSGQDLGTVGDYPTNNKMELLSCIKGFEALNRKNVTVKVYTDSQYVKGGITTWINAWNRNGWKTSNKSDVKNKDLWKKLEHLVQQHNVEWHWVKGHADNVGNQRADELAQAAAVNDCADSVINEMLDEIETLLEEPCPFCGGVHLTLEQIHVLKLDEFKIAYPCGPNNSVALDIVSKAIGKFGR